MSRKRYAEEGEASKNSMKFERNTRAGAKRKKMTKGSPEHRMHERRIDKKCREAKEGWLNKECKEIEKAKYKSVEGMTKRIGALTRINRCISMDCVEGKLVTLTWRK